MVLEKIRPQGTLEEIFQIYNVEKWNAVLYMPKEKGNLLFNTIREATKKSRKFGTYFIEDKQDIDSIINSNEKLTIVLSDLQLTRYDNEWSYFEVSPENYDSLNTSQKLLADRVKSIENDVSRIYVLNPEYVKKNIPKNGALGRVFDLLTPQSFELGVWP